MRSLWHWISCASFYCLCSFSLFFLYKIMTKQICDQSERETYLWNVVKIPKPFKIWDIFLLTELLWILTNHRSFYCEWWAKEQCVQKASMGFHIAERGWKTILGSSKSINSFIMKRTVFCTYNVLVHYPLKVDILLNKFGIFKIDKYCLVFSLFFFLLFFSPFLFYFILSLWTKPIEYAIFF